MSEIEDRLKKEFAEAAYKAFSAEVDPATIVIALPKDKAHGDYAANLAMRLCKQAGLKPVEAAQKLMDNFNCDAVGADHMEIAGPGFLNLFMKQDSLQTIITKVLAGNENYGKSEAGKHLKVDVEYVSANPTGDLHPGHARGAAMGDSVTRMMKMAGYDVTREYYVNDAGNQIGMMALSLQARYLQLYSTDAEVPENGYHGEDLVVIAKRIQEEYGDRYASMAKEESLAFFREYGLKAELEKLKTDLKEFRCEFDVFTSEQDIRDRGLVEKALATLKEKGYTYESEGALWLKTTEFNDDKDRVLVKSDGSYTYLMPDIAYHLDKLDRGFDELVDLLGADHHGYIPRLKAAIRALGYEDNKLQVDIIQMARMIKDGEEFKLSKRSGKAVALRDLLDEAGTDAVRWYFASRAGDTQMDFDLDLAVKQNNENPVYYAQYAHARMSSILRSAGDIDNAENYGLITTAKEMTLLKEINEFPSVVADAAASRMPHKMVNYISRLASTFHSFYNESKVIDPENPALSAQRVGLVKACQITIRNALYCIGVSAPEQM